MSFRPTTRATALCAAITVGALSPLAAQAKTSVGLLLPYSGVFAALGNEIEAGFTVAMEAAGATDQFDIIKEDTEVKPPVGLAKARKLVLEDEVDVIVGVVSSGVLGAMRDFVHDAEVPLLVANAGNDHATGEQCSPYITRVSFSNAQINRPMGDWLAGSGVKTAYIMAADYAAGHQTMAAFKESFTAAGGEIVGEEYTPFRKTKDFGPYLTKAKASGAEAVYVFYAGGEAISFVKQYDSFGLKDQMGLYSGGFLTSPLYVNAEGPAAEGVITALHYMPTLDTPENKAFVDAYTAKYGKGPSEFAVQGYDAAHALLSSQADGETRGAELSAALSRYSANSPRGPISIDPATNNIVQNIYIYETVAGENGLTQRLIDTVENVQDAPNGCVL